MLPADCVIQPGGPVSVEDLERARTSRIFKEWVDSLEPGFVVGRITITAVDSWGGGVRLVRLAIRTADVPFDQIVELRGGTVVMLVVLTCEGIDYTILVKQPRIPSGQWLFVEVPAGMLDDGQFKSTAMKEIGEELGLHFSEEQLTDLTERLPGDGPRELYFSPGLLDEKARFYLAKREVTRDELEALQGKATGKADEGEKIVLMVIPLADLPRYARDMKSITALWLYQNVQK
jgi:8-oxo-dGTP pyrophosphatase MutT (NUDIX family)